MDAKSLRRLNRKELLELLLEEIKRNEELQAKLEEKEIKTEKIGSIADAALELNNVFEAAQDAADMYLEKIQDMYNEAEELLQKVKAKDPEYIEEESEEHEEERSDTENS